MCCFSRSLITADRVVVCGVVLVVSYIVSFLLCVCVCDLLLLSQLTLSDQWFGPHAVTHEVVGSTPGSATFPSSVCDAKETEIPVGGTGQQHTQRKASN